MSLIPKIIEETDEVIRLHKIMGAKRNLLISEL